MPSSWLLLVAICCRDCVWVSVAVCAIMSLVLMGLLGSWYFISATSSLRNVSPPIWSPRSTEVVAEFVATLLMAEVSLPLTGAVIGGSPSHAHVHAPGRGHVAGGGRAPRAEVGGTHPRARAAAGRTRAVAALLLRRLLLRCLLLGLLGRLLGALLRRPRAAGVAVDVEPRADEPGGLQVAPEVG